jgi:hypothetical protein
MGRMTSIPDGPIGMSLKRFDLAPGAMWIKVPTARGVGLEPVTGGKTETVPVPGTPLFLSVKEVHCPSSEGAVPPLERRMGAVSLGSLGAEASLAE